jgi:hypothetical protein
VWLNVKLFFSQGLPSSSDIKTKCYELTSLFLLNGRRKDSLLGRSSDGYELFIPRSSNIDIFLGMFCDVEEFFGFSSLKDDFLGF